MIWVEATPLCGRRIRLFVDGLKSVVMIWVEATPLCGRRMRLFVDGLKSVVMIWGRLRLFVNGRYYAGNKINIRQQSYFTLFC